MDMEGSSPAFVGRRHMKNDCRNCKRKGIRCSQTHPACQECLQKGLHCRFLLSRGGPAAWRTTNAPSTSTGPEMAALSSGNEVAQTVATSMPATLPVTAFKGSIEASWLLNHYIHRPVLQQILIASSSLSHGAAADSASTAIAATLFARFHDLPRSQPARSPYCKEYANAVQALTVQIPRFDRERLEEVVVPALLLLIAESWLTGRSREHFAGLEQLVRVSGESLYQGGRFNLFLEVRSAMVWYAMSRGERTVFGEEWWKTVPFALAPSPKTPSDYLVDYMSDIAALLADAKKTYHEAVVAPSIELEHRARAILHQLFSWRWSWLARSHNAVLEQDAKDTEPFGTFLRFTSPDLMYEIWLCDALVILMLSFLHLQGKHPIPKSRSTGFLWIPNDNLSIHEAAVEICRSLDYQLENLSAPVPAHQWAMPLALAYIALEPTDPVAAWVLAKIQAAPENRSWPWLCYIRRLEGNDRDATSEVFGCWPIKRRRNPLQLDFRLL